MSRGPQNFRQRDVTKAVKALAAAGKSVAEIRVDKTGAHIVVAGEAIEAKATAEEPNEWDRI
jgi:hypothetical protein